VQPHKVILRKSNASNVIDLQPDVLPSAQELEDKLNEIYGKQMNVHFHVNSMNTIGPLNYNTGMGAAYDADYPGTAGNIYLDYVKDASLAISNEENALYTAGHIDSPNVINVYFLPSFLCGHGTPDSYPAAVARIRKKSALMGIQFPLANDPQGMAEAIDQLARDVAHEIGHLGMGLGGAAAQICLRHPRENGKLDTNPSSPHYLKGFPLRRQSEDMKRLMWWEGSLEHLLIYDEWMKFRNSKQ
jgi:hypothetical protein